MSDPKFCTVLDVTQGHVDLTLDHVKNKITGKILEAERYIKASLSGVYRVSRFQDFDPVPETLKELCVLKARELSYMEVPDATKSETFKEDFDNLLKKVIKGFAKIEGAEKVDDEGGALGSVEFLGPTVEGTSLITEENRDNEFRDYN